MGSPESEEFVSRLVRSAPQRTDSGGQTLAGHITHRANRRALKGEEDAMLLETRRHLFPPEDFEYTGEPLHELDWKQLGELAQRHHAADIEMIDLPLVRGVLHEAATRLARTSLDSTITAEIHGYIATIGFAEDTIAFMEGQAQE